MIAISINVRASRKNYLIDFDVLVLFFRYLVLMSKRIIIIVLHCYLISNYLIIFIAVMYIYFFVIFFKDLNSLPTIIIAKANFSWYN